MADSQAGPGQAAEATGSQTQDTGDPSLARGSAGLETGARAGAAHEHTDLEDRRETEQVLRPTSDGMGEGLTKDQS